MAFHFEHYKPYRLMRLVLPALIELYFQGDIAQVCDSALSPFPTLQRLEIYIWRDWQDDMENAKWVVLLHPFASSYLMNRFNVSHRPWNTSLRKG